VAVVLVLAACGGGSPQDAKEPKRSFTVQVAHASFPGSQRLSQHTHLVIAVRNLSNTTIPNVAVTICNVTCTYPAPTGEGTSVQPFSVYLDQPYLANHSRPVWVVDKPPGLCGYSYQQGGAGAAVTAYSNTWALGTLPPNGTATFDWGVTAVRQGSYTVAWEVAAGLNGKAKAVLPDGSTPRGTFAVSISNKPPNSYVTDSGQIVNK
jgi:hypothetical protein